MGSSDITKVRRFEPRRVRPLSDLEPRFVSDGTLIQRYAGTQPVHRYGMGLSILCPRHGDDHRVTLWFLNPDDGDPPKPGESRYYYRLGSTRGRDVFDGLTLERASRDWDAVDIDGCWAGYIVEGMVTDAFGVAW